MHYLFVLIIFAVWRNFLITDLIILKSMLFSVCSYSYLLN